jgi:hypothetical protein
MFAGQKYFISESLPEKGPGSRKKGSFKIAKNNKKPGLAGFFCARGILCSVNHSSFVIKTTHCPEEGQQVTWCFPPAIMTGSDHSDSEIFSHFKAKGPGRTHVKVNIPAVCEINRILPAFPGKAVSLIIYPVAQKIISGLGYKDVHIVKKHAHAPIQVWHPH